MKEYIERGEQESILHNRYDKLAGLRPDFYAGYMLALHTIEDDVPTAADVVSKGLYEQIKWERDLAIEQLQEYGVSLGEKADVVKVVRCKDCIHWGCYGGEYAHKGECKMCESEGCWYEDDYCSYGERMDKEE